MSSGSAAVNFEMPDEDKDNVSEQEYTRYTVRVPRSAKELAMQKAEHGEMSEKVRTLFQTVAFGEEVGERSQLQRELSEIRQKKDEKRAKKREIETEIANLEQRETRIEDQISSLSSQEDKFEGMLEMLEELLYDGVRMWPDNGKVQKAAAMGSLEPEGVIKKLKERNPSIPGHAFESKMKARKEWRGISEDETREE